jgi:hypothetical protein
MAEPIDIDALVSVVASVDVESMGYDELASLVIGEERLLNAVHALSAVTLAKFERQGGWAADGAMSPAGWAAARTGTPTRCLRARARAGAGLRLLPRAEPAARTGRLCPQRR